MRKIIITLLVVLSLGFESKAQVDAQTFTRFGYEFNVGTFDNEYIRLNHSVSLNKQLSNKFLFGVQLGRSYLSSRGMGNYDADSKYFFREERQTLIGGIGRYYILDKKITPFAEGRIGITFGDKTERISPTFGGVIGYSLRFKKASAISIGYHPEFVRYFSSTYFTDGKGETVYRVDNFHPKNKISHNLLINIIF